VRTFDKTILGGETPRHDKNPLGRSEPQVGPRNPDGVGVKENLAGLAFLAVQGKPELFQLVAEDALNADGAEGAEGKCSRNDAPQLSVAILTRTGGFVKLSEVLY
jgi:hypothetical protein